MRRVWTLRVAIACAAALASCAQTMTAEMKAKLASKLPQLQAIGKDPKVVAAVVAYNAAPPAEARGMTNEKWKGLTLLDPLVRSFSKNPLAVYLKSKQDESISEMFVSGAGGGKVAFLAKPSSFSHKGNEKHDVPMAGRLWQGEPEVDESTGQLQVQVGVPVLDGARPVGSIVIGLKVAQLK